MGFLWKKKLHHQSSIRYANGGFTNEASRTIHHRLNLFNKALLATKLYLENGNGDWGLLRIVCRKIFVLRNMAYGRIYLVLELQSMRIDGGLY